MLCVVHLHLLAEGEVGSLNALGLVDADLLRDGEVQRKVQERVHLAAFRCEFALDSGLRVFQQSVIFGVLGDEVGSGGLGAFEDQSLTVLAPRFAEEVADLFAGGVKHALLSFVG